MTTSALHTDGGVEQLALTKMTNVLGAHRARELHRLLIEDRQGALQTADDLFAFGVELRRFGGFEAAVGAMLQVQAVMRGARRS